MSVLVTPDEMRVAEAAAIASGRPERELMRAAAEQIADWIDSNVRRRTGEPRLAVALVGPGNNGGDALVALAILIERGWRCAAVFMGRSGLGDLPASDSLIRQVEVGGVEAFDAANVILDGVYGVGGRASLPDDVATAFRRALDMRIDHGTPLVAIDVPSGIDPASGAADPDAFQADVTLCLGLPKWGLVREPAASHAGELEVLDIGVTGPEGDRRPRLIDERAVRRSLPRRRVSAHKHQTGAVLVIGGAPAYYGAPRLSAEAAARAGAGLVCVAAPAAVIPVIAAQVPELVFLPLDESASLAAEQTAEWIRQRNGHLDSIVVGPGLSQSAFASAFLDQVFGGNGAV
ncbi:MAG: NAD(P)H-hydrate epimerase, partial [Thermomicrobiales bacterium]